ncbi:hypothetical protein MIR68_004080 [Amoeboaphelidium protococcarum]|nr:hypothetical protein MIR68_004080 [Amoeboaphelidium protococcarum]
MVCQLCLNSVYGLFSMLQVLYRSVFASQKGRNVLLYQYEDLRAKQIESILTSTSSYLGMFGVFMEFVFSVSLSAVTISSWIIASLDSQAAVASSSSLKWSSQLGGLVNSFLILLNMVQIAPKFDKTRIQQINLISASIKEIKDAFTPVAVDVAGIVTPVNKVQVVLKSLSSKQLTLNIKGVQSVQVYDEQNKLILLKEGIRSIPKEEQLESSLQWLSDAQIENSPLKFDFEHFNAQDLINCFVQTHSQDDSLQFGCSYEHVGHIAHLNLGDDSPLHRYRFVIGAILLEKTPNASLIVRKVGKIESTFRTFDMEFDYRRVYWNSRLGHEHERLTKLIHSGDKSSTVLDVFCGVGPFSIPLTKLKHRVYANDLNPDSIHWLKQNATLNKLKFDEELIVEGDSQQKSPETASSSGLRKSASLLSISNEDGRHFMRRYLPKLLADGSNNNAIHMIMNLPAIAIEFLDVIGEFYRNNGRQMPNVTVHCHCFTKNVTNAREDIIGRMEKSLSLPRSLFDIQLLHHVRTVAPNKDMFCVSFKLKSGEDDCSQVKVKRVSDEQLVDDKVKVVKLDEN